MRLSWIDASDLDRAIYLVSSQHGLSVRMMKRYALIFGGELRNRGAQDMSLRTISVLKNSLPEIEPVLVSIPDAPQPLFSRIRGKKNRKDLDNLSFQIIWGDPALLYGDVPDSSVSLRIKSSAKRLVYSREQSRFFSYLRDAALCIDISGFAFGSQWGYNKCQRYLNKIQLMCSHNIPMYILPQSFGPFSFDEALSYKLQSRSSKVLTWPRMICAREKQGLDEIQALCPNARCTLEDDIVLQGGEINVSDVFVDVSEIPSFPGIESDHNVGIVPNARTFEHGDAVQLKALYGSIIEGLLRHNYHVYIIRHSEDDELICAQMKSMFSDNPNVILRNEDRYCFQYEELFTRCDFLIASRFHSIVHAYRSGVPCLALGWATKYVELLERFEQQRYMHDVRQLDDSVVASVFSRLHELEDSHEEESRTILSHMNTIWNRPSVFDRVIDDYRSISCQA